MAATLLSGASLYAQATTYVYTGNPFTNVSGVYTASDLISGYITLSTPLKDNISNASVVPAGDVRSYVVTFEFSDGAYIWSPTNSYVNTGIFSTDSNGDFSVWTLGLQGYAPPLIDCGGACFGYLQTTNDLPTVDGVSANDLTGNFGQGDGSNGFPNSPPDPGSWVVATKDSPLFCPSGANGSGNNYYPTKAHCDSGAVVPWGFLLCPAGADGRGGVYDPYTHSCTSGAIAPVVPPPGDLVCSAGSNGPGGIYDPSEATCESGAVIAFGDLYCPVGSNGPGGIYNPSNATCEAGALVPFGDLYCSVGYNGPGGIYDPATTTCVGGALVPIGDSYCHAGPLGPGGIYNPAASTCNKGKIEPR